MMNRMYYNRGVGLIEVFVALLVMGMGVMGFAALQLVSVKASEGTYANDQGMAVAQDIIERIKANPGGTQFYIDQPWIVNNPTPNLPSPCLLTEFDPPNACDAQQMVNHDISEVIGYLQAALPEGAVDINQPCLRRTSQSDNPCVVVAWGGATTDLINTNDNSCYPDEVDTTNDPNNAVTNRCVVVEFIVERQPALRPLQEVANDEL